MFKKINKTIEIFDSEICDIESEIEDVLKKAEACIKVSKKAIISIRKIILNNDFKKQSDEIQFFKEIKPKVYSKLIYYVKLFNIESKRPRGVSKSQKKYLDYQINKCQNYFNENIEFYQYFRRGSVSLDKQYFIRGNEDIRLHPDDLYFFMDEKFSTSHDSTVANIMAYDMLIVYLKQEIDKLENKNTMETIMQTNQYNSKLFWTGSKVDLVELIYALHASGVINSGVSDIKDLATIFEQMFNIQLGDFYRTYLEIKLRKISNTKFLDALKVSLLKRMEESDI